MGPKATEDSPSVRRNTSRQKNDFCKFHGREWTERTGGVDRRSRLSLPPVGRGRQGAPPRGKRFAQTFPPHSRRTTASPGNAASRPLVLLKRVGSVSVPIGDKRDGSPPLERHWSARAQGHTGLRIGGAALTVVCMGVGEASG